MNTREEIQEMIDESDYKLILNTKTGEVFSADPLMIKEHGGLPPNCKIAQDITTVDWILLVQWLLELNKD